MLQPFVASAAVASVAESRQQQTVRVICDCQQRSTCSGAFVLIDLALLLAASRAFQPSAFGSGCKKRRPTTQSAGVNTAACREQ